MDIQSMPREILRIANAMIRESLLPDCLAAYFDPHRVRITALDQLHRPLQRDIRRGSQQQMHMVRHDHKSMQRESSLPPISVQSFQEKPGVRFHNEESSALEGRERYKISSGRRHQSRRFHSVAL